MASQNGTVLELDAVIVGAGFSDLGGTWHRNTYPGARVDCPAPTYGFGIEEVWRSWNWSEVYPGQQEIQSYFEHVDKVLSVRKDCIFNSRVTSAHFNPAKAKWTIRTDDGRTTVAQHFVPAVGFATKQYIPAWKGVELFEGIIHHSSLWPKEGVDVRGKRVAIIGTGSTGVQIIQEWAKEAAETHVFQRTPNLCLPMDQMKLDSTARHKMQAQTGDLFARCRLTGGGLPEDGPSKMFSEFSLEDCENAVNQLYDQGGFRLWAGTYKDLLLNNEANRVTYDIWAKRTRQRIQDPVKRDLLAPLEPPHPFGTKRPSLEQDYYEQFNKPNVHIVNTKKHPIVELTPRGIMTEDGKVHEVDVIAIATGFDASTGSLGEMGICDVNGIDLGARWSKEAVTTFLGLMVPGFPNMFLPIQFKHQPLLQMGLCL